jgi:hypothetical protein
MQGCLRNALAIDWAGTRGRVLGVTGVRGEPEVYYFGAVGGGVWKTNDGADGNPFSMRSRWRRLSDRGSAVEPRGDLRGVR